MILGDIGDHRVGHGHARVHDKVQAGGFGQRPQGFQINEAVGQFFPNVRGVGDSVVVGNGRGQAQKLFAHGNAVRHAGAAVHEGEIVDHGGGMFPFTAHEHAVPGDQDVVEDDQGIGMDAPWAIVGKFQRD
jgi:hypothetical protein